MLVCVRAVLSGHNGMSINPAASPMYGSIPQQQQQGGGAAEAAMLQQLMSEINRLKNELGES